MKLQTMYDVIIVGGSYAGLASAMTLGRALRSVLVIDNGDPCNKQTPYSHNFLTNDGREPQEIAAIARQELAKYSTVVFVSATVREAVKGMNGFAVTIETNEVYTGRKLVLATGIKDLMPAIPGFAECWGISVLHCPYCHGYEVRKQKTGIMASGDSGYEFASLIANWTDDLTLFTNGGPALTAQQSQQLGGHNINVVETEIERIEHDNGHIEGIVFRKGDKVPVEALYARLPFVQHSFLPQQLGCELADGYIRIDSAQKTSVPGVFACGDNATRIRTVANAVAMGTTTGIMVNKELVEEEF